MTTVSTSSSGTVTTTGSTTYISSSASGLDTSSLIATAMATYTASADTIDAEVTTNTTKISAYTDVQTLVNALSSSIDDLASSTNVASGTNGLWTTTAATVTSSDSSVTASNVVSASSTSSAVDGSYTLGVSQLATAEKVSTVAAPDDAALNETGTFTIGSSDGTAATISVTSDMTLSDIAAAITAQSSTTGVNATLIQSSTGEYSLVLSTADTGQTIKTTAASGDDVMTAIGVTSSSGGAFTNVIQKSQDAIFTLDGTSITRTSNSIDDVIPGVTLDLTGTTGSTAPLTLTIAQDDSGVTTAVNAFVTAYNDLHEYLETQNAASSTGAVSSTAYLFGDSTLQSLNDELNTLITGATASSGASSGSISYLTQLGITLNSSNDLELSDPGALSTAIASNSSALQSFFQSSYTTSNPRLLLMSNTSTVSQSFTLDIQADTTGITGATVNGQSGMFTVSGNELIGAAGTAYAGLTFAITATTDTSVDVDLQQGFADSVVAVANQYGDTSTGLLETQITNLTSTDTTLSARSATIHSQATAYETTLIDKYATMETAISSAKLMQEEIDALLNATSSS